MRSKAYYLVFFIFLLVVAYTSFWFTIKYKGESYVREQFKTHIPDLLKRSMVDLKTECDKIKITGFPFSFNVNITNPSAVVSFSAFGPTIAKKMEISSPSLVLKRKVFSDNLTIILNSFFKSYEVTEEAGVAKAGRVYRCTSSKTGPGNSLNNEIGRLILTTDKKSFLFDKERIQSVSYRDQGLKCNFTGPDGEGELISEDATFIDIFNGHIAEGVDVRLNSNTASFKELRGQEVTYTPNVELEVKIKAQSGVNAVDLNKLIITHPNFKAQSTVAINFTDNYEQLRDYLTLKAHLDLQNYRDFAKYIISVLKLPPSENYLEIFTGVLEAAATNRNTEAGDLTIDLASEPGQRISLGTGEEISAFLERMKTLYDENKLPEILPDPVLPLPMSEEGIANQLHTN